MPVSSSLVTLADFDSRAVEVALDQSKPHPVNPKEMMAVLNLMSSSPVAMFVKSCSVQQKMMMAAVVRCVRREGVAEIAWRSVSDFSPTYLEVMR